MTNSCPSPSLVHSASCSPHRSCLIGFQKQHVTSVRDAPSLGLHYCMVCMVILLCSFSKPTCFLYLFIFIHAFKYWFSKIWFSNNLTHNLSFFFRVYDHQKSHFKKKNCYHFLSGKHLFIFSLISKCFKTNMN